MPEPSVKITIVPNGAARVECEEAQIVMPNGDVIIKKNKFSLCRCGHSNNKPFCDSSHHDCGFVG